MSKNGKSEARGKVMIRNWCEEPLDFGSEDDQEVLFTYAEPDSVNQGKV